jgi:transcription-repair coupling factor (superfamily II helicase)
MRDLEIRGAGNLLGMEQHGHIESIGYDLYVKYLGEAVRRLKGEVVDERIDTTVDIKIDGFISDRYIEDEDQKIEIYKKISSVESMDDYRELIDELIDRFGDLPKPVENLMNISYIRALSSKNGIKNILQLSDRTRLDFASPDWLKPELINQLSGKYGGEIEFDLSTEPGITITTKTDIINRLKDLVEAIDNFSRP